MPSVRPQAIAATEKQKGPVEGIKLNAATTNSNAPAAARMHPTGLSDTRVRAGAPR